MQTRRFYSNRISLIMMLISSLIFLYTNCIMFIEKYNTNQDDSVRLMIIGAAIVFFTGCLFILIYRLVKPKLQIELSETAVKYKSGKGYTVVPWNEIDSFQEVTFNQQKMIAIIPKKSEQVFKDAGAPLYLYPSATAIRSQKLLLLLEEYHTTQKASS
jgi:hypothetical protein